MKLQPLLIFHSRKSGELIASNGPHTQKNTPINLFFVGVFLSIFVLKANESFFSVSRETINPQC